MSHDSSPSFTIYCIGRNYALHIAELQNERPSEPVVFLKSPQCLRDLKTGPLAFAEETFAYEAEVVLKMHRSFMIGEVAQWQDIEWFGLGIDLTRREKQSELKSKGLPWTLAKSFQGSALVGEFKHITDEALKKSLQFEFSLKGELKQKAAISEMLWSLPDLMTYLNSFSPLQAGDLIFTGTPQGVGSIRRGDTFELRCSQIGQFQGQL